MTKNNTALYQKIGWTALTLIVVGLLALISYLAFTTERAVPTSTQQSTNTAATQDAFSQLNSLLEADAVSSLTGQSELATLNSVRNEQEYGVASRLTVDGTYNLEVVALSIPPAPGKFYEVWLVGSEVLSAGALEEDEIEPNTYVLSYTSDRDLSALNKVVITEETLANGLDNIPETHTIEGSF